MPYSTLQSRRSFRGAVALLTLLCCLGFVSHAEAGLKIYYLRHAEGGHNVVDQWKNVPKEQRPAYVGNANMFTPKGEAQVEALAKKLSSFHFDFIAVSPLWRTRHTILPYLKAAGRKAEVWPELHEFLAGRSILASNLPPLSAPVLGAGPRVEVPADEDAYFTIREDGKNNYRLPVGKGPNQEAAIRAVTQHTIDLLQQHFGGSDKSVLLVGHGNSGIALLRLLTKDPLAKMPPMANTSLWMVEEQPDGQFQLKLYNDAPYEPTQPVAAQHSHG